MKTKKFLCLIIDSDSRSTLQEYEIESTDWVFARHKAAKEFQKLAHYSKRYRGLNWEVDSTEIEVAG